MLSDIEIAHGNVMEPLVSVFGRVGLLAGDDFETYGEFKAKMTEDGIKSVSSRPDGQVVLVTAISPTPAGEGKTTTAIGLADALRLEGKNAVLALREPSLGPVFGLKGGACGGGYAQVQPMEDINLHFMGDFHAIGAANNLLCAVLDNSIMFGNPLGINTSKVFVKRCVDMNDRALRDVVIGLNGNGVVRSERFQITVASEVMAILCLASGLEDLKDRLSKMVIAERHDGSPVTVGDLGCVGSMAALLKDAIRPNLAQTLEHTPVVIHGGPFANIAHGCNSIRATYLAQKLGEVVVTEAGFGADLGAEKFFDIKCRLGVNPGCVVLVASIRALKYNGGMPKDSLCDGSIEFLSKGLSSNFMRHYQNLMKFNVPVVLAINSFETDTDDEVSYIKTFCSTQHISYAFNTSFKDGGTGAVELAKVVSNSLKMAREMSFLYGLSSSLEEKIDAVCKGYYGADSVSYSSKARAKLAKLQDCHLPICVAKTQYSFSDDPKKLGAPKGFTVTVSDLSLSAGAGFVVVYLGDIMTMPGLPQSPVALTIDVSNDGVVSGLS